VWVKSRSRTQEDWREQGAALVRLLRKHPDLRGTQATFQRLLRLPRPARYAFAALGRAPGIASALVDTAAFFARSIGRPAHHPRLHALERALFSLNGALREAGTWYEFDRTFRVEPAQ
jgi:hypothetical protein